MSRCWVPGGSGWIESNEPYVDHVMNQAVEIEGIEAVYPDSNTSRWVARDGTVTAFEDLSDSHLINIHKYLLRMGSNSKIDLVKHELKRRMR